MAVRVLLVVGVLLGVALGVFAAPAGARTVRFTWSRPAVVDRAPISKKADWIGEIVCPSASFCAALDGNGELLTTERPASGAHAWTARRIVQYPDSLAALACPSAGLCVAVTDGGGLLSSTNPTGPASAWRLTAGVPYDIPGVEADATFAVACPTTSLCVAANGNEGTLMVTTDPAGGSWQPEQVVDPASGCELGEPSPCAQQITALACPSATACVAVDDDGNALSSTDPAGGASTWHPVATQLDPIPGAIDALNQLACASASLCVAADTEHDAVAASLDPTAADATWTARQVTTGFGFLLGLACPTTTLCVGSRGTGPLVVSSDPGAGIWRTLRIGLLNGGPVSCVGSGFCAVAGGGAMAVSGSPAAGAAAWSHEPVSDVSITALACPTRTLCVAGDIRGGISTGHRV